MAHRYELTSSAAHDLFKLTRRDQPLLFQIGSAAIPEILRDPLKAGDQKKGDLAHVRAHNLRVRGNAYRLVYTVEGDVVTFIAIGLHDAAYERARRR